MICNISNTTKGCSAAKVNNLLIEIWLWDLQVSAVSDSLYGKDKGLSSEHSQLAYHLSWVGHKQAHGLLFVDHPLVDMQATRQDEVQTHVLYKPKQIQTKQNRNGRTFRCCFYKFICRKRSVFSMCFVPGLPVLLKQPQLLHGAESLSHSTKTGPGHKKIMEKVIKICCQTVTYSDG